MGKPRLIILIRHAQSEANIDKNIHQHTADHKVKLTQEGWEQSRGAGRKLRGLLRSDDTLHFFISPYRRTRETTEGILETLCSNDPDPSPFQRSQMKVYEEPRIREQDFGNFQPNRDEVDRIWRERATYGHFFYRVPNGESGADCADRCSSFNESLWRRFSDPDMASVAIIVSHGMVIRCFLMRWYHFSVEYFEDLRNINHVEFIVMKLRDNGRYQLQNQLRTWTELKRERAARASISSGSGEQAQPSSIPPRRTWACPDGCTEPSHGHSQNTPKLVPVRKNTADLFRDDNELITAGSRALSGSPPVHRDFAISPSLPESSRGVQNTPNNAQTGQLNASLSSLSSLGRKIRGDTPEDYEFRGRDGGGSKSGIPSPSEGSDEDEPYTNVPPGPRDKSDTVHFSAQIFKPGSLGKALRGQLESNEAPMADALGDQSDVEDDENEKQRRREEENRILEDERRERKGQNSQY